MARGMANNEPIVSMARTKEFDEGWDKMEHSDDGRRGTFVWVKGRGLVPADEYEPPERAVDAPIMVDRHYEGTKALDGTDIGSRRKHRAYMKANGLTTFDDYSPGYFDRVHREREAKAKKDRREAIGRALYQMDKP